MLRVYALVFMIDVGLYLSGDFKFGFGIGVIVVFFFNLNLFILIRG